MCIRLSTSHTTHFGVHRGCCLRLTVLRSLGAVGVGLPSATLRPPEQEVACVMADSSTNSNILDRFLSAISDLIVEDRRVQKRNSKIQEQGHRTMGTVVKVERRFSMEDSRSERYYLIYEFKIDGREFQRRNKVRRIRKVKPGDNIIVYYLPGSRRPASAIDWKPRRLTSEEMQELDSTGPLS